MRNLNNVYIIIFVILLVGCSDNNRHSSKGFDKINYLFSHLDTVDFKSNGNRIKIDSIYSESKRLPLGKKRNEIYRKVAGLYYDLGDYSKYFTVSKQLSNQYLRSNDSIGAANSFYYIAAYYNNIANYDSAYYYYSKAEKYLSEKSSENIGDIINSKANILSYHYDFAGAEVKAISALKIANIQANHRLIYDALLTIGNAEIGMNNLDNGVKYYLKASKSVTYLKSDSQYEILKAQPYNYISKAYKNAKKYGTAIYYSEKALAFCDYKVVDLATYAYLKNNNLYSKLKRGDSVSKNSLIEILDIGLRLKSKPIVITSNLNLSEFYFINSDYKNALEYANRARQMAHNDNIFEDELKALVALEKYDTTNIVRYKNDYIRISDSLHAVERSTREKFSRIEFESEQIIKERDRATAEKEQINHRFVVVLLSCLLLSALAVGVYFNAKQKAKSKEVEFLNKQNSADKQLYQLMFEQSEKIEAAKIFEKNRISKELHDGIIGKLMGVRMNLYILRRNPDQETILECLEYIKSLQDIEKEIRGISHELYNAAPFEGGSFTAMLEDFIKNAAEQFGLNYEINIEVSIKWDLIRTDVRIQIYRILQELVQNTVKHANASEVVLKILGNGKEGVEIIYSDNGVGFKFNEKTSGIGLKSIIERTQNIGSKLIIISQPQHETRFHVRYII